jgi:hypothetical protein
METVALPNIQRERGSVADSIRGNFYCLARELKLF